MRIHRSIASLACLLMTGPALTEEVQPAEQGVREAPALGNQEIVIIQGQIQVEGLALTVVEQKEDKTDASKQAAPEAKPKEPTEKELRDKMNRLQKELNEARNAFQQKANQKRGQKQQKPEISVKNINLPKNATREQAQQFINKLRKAAESKRGYSSNDPIVSKLKQVPSEHFDLLLNEMSNRTRLRYYANYAMRGIAPETIRKRLVSTIGQNDNNIGMIVMNGWCQDIRPEIVRKINAADKNLPPSWFQAAVEIEDPSLYPKMHEITIQSRYAMQFINMLRALPDYDLAHTVNAAWARSQEGKTPVNSTSLAPVAIEFGNTEALGSQISQLRNVNSFTFSQTAYNVRRVNILRFIDYRGSNEEIQNWYKTNKDSLVFDYLRKRFVVADDF